jgi:hypothetical protein
VSALRTLYKLWAATLFIAVVVQVGLAGYGAFNARNKAEDHKLVTEHQLGNGFDPHTGLGYLIFLGAIVLFVLALAARLGKQKILWALAALLLVVVQILLAYGAEDATVVGFFHAVNALAVFGLTGFLAHRAWRGPAAT